MSQALTQLGIFTAEAILIALLILLVLFFFRFNSLKRQRKKSRQAGDQTPQSRLRHHQGRITG